MIQNVKNIFYYLIYDLLAWICPFLCIGAFQELKTPLYFFQTLLEGAWKIVQNKSKIPPNSSRFLDIKFQKILLIILFFMKN